MPHTTAAVALQRCVPWLGYHHILMMLNTVGIVLLSLVLAGCSSYSTMTDIFVLALLYGDSSIPKSNVQANANLSSILHELRGASQLEVRVGYFGYCVRRSNVGWICSSDGQALLEEFGPDQDPLNLLWVANQFQSNTIFTGLIFFAIALTFGCLLLLATFPGWHYEHDDLTGSDIDVKPFPSRPVCQVALSFSFAAACFALISAMWQHTAAVATASLIRAVGYGNIAASVGPQSLILLWFSVGVLAVVAVGLYVMLASMSVLDRLTGD